MDVYITRAMSDAIIIVFEPIAQVSGTSTPFTILPGTLTYVVITPNNIQLTNEEIKEFVCHGEDMYHNQVPEQVYHWQVIGDIGTLSTITGTSTVFYAGTTTKKGYIIASSGTVTGTATVIVGLDHFVFSHIGTLTAGVPFRFSFYAMDKWGNTATITHGDCYLYMYINGTYYKCNRGYTDLFPFYAGISNEIIAYKGLPMSVDAMAFFVEYVNDSSKCGTSNTFCILPAEPVAISILPEMITISIDERVMFDTVAKDRFGNTWTVTSETMFTTTDQKGTISGNAYMPGMLGTWSIVATYGTLSATATVSVIHGKPVELYIIPDKMTIASGEKLSLIHI